MVTFIVHVLAGTPVGSAPVVGIANFVTFLENTGAYRRGVREAEYGSLEHDRPLLEEISPMRLVDRISAPLMVVRGKNDPRVPLSEAQQIVYALRARGVPVEFLVYSGEGHGLVELASKLDAYPRVAAFLKQHLVWSKLAARFRSCRYAQSELGLAAPSGAFIEQADVTAGAVQR